MLLPVWCVAAFSTDTTMGANESTLAKRALKLAKDKADWKDCLQEFVRAHPDRTVPLVTKKVESKHLDVFEELLQGWQERTPSEQVLLLEAACRLLSNKQVYHKLLYKRPVRLYMQGLRSTAEDVLLLAMVVLDRLANDRTGDEGGPVAEDEAEIRRLLLLEDLDTCGEFVGSLLHFLVTPTPDLRFELFSLRMLSGILMATAAASTEAQARLIKELAQPTPFTRLLNLYHLDVARRKSTIGSASGTGIPSPVPVSGAGATTSVDGLASDAGSLALVVPPSLTEIASLAERLILRVMLDQEPSNTFRALQQIALDSGNILWVFLDCLLNAASDAVDDKLLTILTSDFEPSLSLLRRLLDNEVILAQWAPEHLVNFESVPPFADLFAYQKKHATKAERKRLADVARSSPLKSHNWAAFFRRIVSVSGSDKDEVADGPYVRWSHPACVTELVEVIGQEIAGIQGGRFLHEEFARSWNCLSSPRVEGVYLLNIAEDSSKSLPILAHELAAKIVPGCISLITATDPHDIERRLMLLRVMQNLAGRPGLVDVFSRNIFDSFGSVYNFLFSLLNEPIGCVPVHPVVLNVVRTVMTSGNSTVPHGNLVAFFRVEGPRRLVEYLCSIKDPALRLVVNDCLSVLEDCSNYARVAVWIAGDLVPLMKNVVPQWPFEDVHVHSILLLRSLIPQCPAVLENKSLLKILVGYVFGYMLANSSPEVIVSFVRGFLLDEVRGLQLLPPYMLHMLEQQPKQFARVFTDQAETATIFWTQPMRNELAKICQQWLLLVHASLDETAEEDRGLVSEPGLGSGQDATAMSATRRWRLSPISAVDLPPFSPPQWEAFYPGPFVHGIFLEFFVNSLSNQASPRANQVPIAGVEDFRGDLMAIIASRSVHTALALKAVELLHQHYATDIKGAFCLWDKFPAELRRDISFWQCAGSIVAQKPAENADEFHRAALDEELMAAMAKADGTWSRATSVSVPLILTALVRSVYHQLLNDPAVLDRVWLMYAEEALTFWEAACRHREFDKSVLVSRAPVHLLHRAAALRCERSVGILQEWCVHSREVMRPLLKRYLPPSEATVLLEDSALSPICLFTPKMREELVAVLEQMIGSGSTLSSAAAESLAAQNPSPVLYSELRNRFIVKGVFLEFLHHPEFENFHLPAPVQAKCANACAALLVQTTFLESATLLQIHLVLATLVKRSPLELFTAVTASLAEESLAQAAAPLLSERAYTLAVYYEYLHRCATAGMKVASLHEEAVIDSAVFFAGDRGDAAPSANAAALMTFQAAGSSGDYATYSEVPVEDSLEIRKTLFPRILLALVEPQSGRPDRKAATRLVQKGALLFALNPATASVDSMRLVGLLCQSDACALEATVAMLSAGSRPLVMDAGVHPEALVKFLVGTNETPFSIWNEATRSYLASFCLESLRQLQHQQRQWKFDANAYVQPSLAAEPVVGGVYLRVFAENKFVQLPKPEKFMQELLGYLLSFEEEPGPPALGWTCLKQLLENHSALQSDSSLMKALAKFLSRPYVCLPIVEILGLVAQKIPPLMLGNILHASYQHPDLTEPIMTWVVLRMVTANMSAVSDKMLEKVGKSGRTVDYVLYPLLESSDTPTAEGSTATTATTATRRACAEVISRLFTQSDRKELKEHLQSLRLGALANDRFDKNPERFVELLDLDFPVSERQAVLDELKSIL